MSSQCSCRKHSRSRSHSGSHSGSGSHTGSDSGTSLNTALLDAQAFDVAFATTPDIESLFTDGFATPQSPPRAPLQQPKLLWMAAQWFAEKVQWIMQERHKKTSPVPLWRRSVVDSSGVAHFEGLLDPENSKADVADTGLVLRSVYIY